MLKKRGGNNAYMKVAIDFDGVLCDRQGLPRSHGFIDCPPMDYAHEALKCLRRNGHEFYILTAREEKDWPAIKKWLKESGLPRIRITNKKDPGTAIYLDDRAVRFTNWIDFCKLIE